MRTDEIDLRDEVLDMTEPHERTVADAGSPEDLVPMHEQGSGTTSFDTVLRGYSKVQVEDYLDRVELALAEADQRHAEDGTRFAAYDAEVASLTERLELAERRASGQPEPASLLTGRLAEMLALAEREAEEIRRAAREDADRTLADVRHRGELDSLERTKALEAREAEVAAAQESVDKIRLEAQDDAERLREKTRTETEALAAEARSEVDALTGSARSQADAMLAQAKADADALVDDAAKRAQDLRTQADEDVRVAHDEAREQNAALVQDAQAQVDELVRQREQVRSQLEGLTDQLDAIRASFAPRT